MTGRNLRERGKKDRPRNTGKTLKRFASYLKPHRLSIFILCVFVFISNAGNLLGPKFAGNAINAASTGGRLTFRALFIMQSACLRYTL